METDEIMIKLIFISVKEIGILSYFIIISDTKEKNVFKII